MTDNVLTPGGAFIEGLVLCRVGDDRLAVPAREVTAFEAAEPNARYAGARFSPGAQPPAEARLLCNAQARLAVDSVQVHAERYAVLSVPPVLAGACGGALTGFVEAGGLLWPVVSLARFTADGDPSLGTGAEP